MEKLQALLSERFQIVFSDTSLLDKAFTHTSYANEHRLLKISHNERLEFLGDAALQLVISVYLYNRYPNKPEGEMSKMRSTIVREESLAGFTKACGFEQYIRLGKGEEKSGGRERATILGDLWEAFLGALYLDQGLPAVEKRETLTASRTIRQPCKSVFRSMVRLILLILLSTSLDQLMPKNLLCR